MPGHVCCTDELNGASIHHFGATLGSLRSSRSRTCTQSTSVVSVSVHGSSLSCCISNELREWALVMSFQLVSIEGSFFSKNKYSKFHDTTVSNIYDWITFTHEAQETFRTWQRIEIWVTGRDECVETSSLSFECAAISPTLRNSLHIQDMMTCSDIFSWTETVTCDMWNSPKHCSSNMTGSSRM